MKIIASFSDPATQPRDFDDCLRRLYKVARALAHMHEAMAIPNWVYSSARPDDLQVHQVFDADRRPSPVVLAELAAGAAPDRASVILISTTGSQGDVAASITCVVGVTPGRLFLSVDDARCQQTGDVLEVIKAIVLAWRPDAVEVGPDSWLHFNHEANEGRPVVGWMLYLPRVIGQAQVPQADMLVPVFDDSLEQAGTIIVTTRDEVFSPHDNSHIERAREITRALQEQGFLP